MKKRTLWIVLVIVILLMKADALYHYPLLPERMATHFGASGKADGWMQKEAFFLFMGFMTAFVAAVCLLPITLLRYIPNEMINLPSKEYWLAPERREATIAAISGQMGVMTAATIALLGAMMHLTYRANLMPEPRLSNSSWVYLAAYLAFTGVWCIGLFRRFARPR